MVRADGSIVARVRLFFSRLGTAALDPERVVERWVRLPARPSEGTLAVRIALPIADVGQSKGTVAAPVDVDPMGSRLPPARGEPARASDPQGGVCVPGGFFWMGDARLPLEGELSANAPRLVYVAPFCVDAHEATVSELRASGVDVSTVGAWGGGTAASEPGSFCTYTSTPGPNDDRPVNCINWSTARAFCRSRGGDLPTEAQYEYLASALGQGSFVWGTEPPACADAVFGRSVGIIAGDTSCVAGSKAAFLPVSASAFAQTRDVLHTATGDVVGLASNVSEWTREAFAPYAAGCGRTPSTLLRDPECPAGDAPSRAAVRGGRYTSSADETAAAVRAFVVLPHIRADVGLRCVR